MRWPREPADLVEVDTLSVTLSPGKVIKQLTVKRARQFLESVPGLASFLKLASSGHYTRFPQNQVLDFSNLAIRGSPRASVNGFAGSGSTMACS